MTRLYAGLTLAGGMQARSPVAIGPRNDLDNLAHRAPSYAASRGRVDAAAMLVSPGDTVLVSERRF